MSGVRLRPLVAKEIRALLPAWLATLAAIGAAALSAPSGHTLGLVAYGFGSTALGAQTVGHEYTHRTLSLLLTQPVSRRRLLLVKLGVLTAMLLTLAGVARVMLLGSDELGWVYASLLCSLVGAPLLTMLCRNPLAGIVLTGALPVWASVLRDAVSAPVLWGVTLVISIPAAAASWHLFMRLEAVDGRGSELELPRVFRRTRATASPGGVLPRDPLRQLVKKELHLQQLTFAVAAVWAVLWGMMSALPRFVPGYVTFPIAAVSILFGALLAVLIGSLASAEERHIGTLEWQLLLPIAAWKQWAVKVGTALGIAGLLSFVFPVLLATGEVRFSVGHAAAIVFLTVGSLYVSSLCRSGVRALIVSAPIMLIVALLSLWVATFLSGNPRGLLMAPTAGVVACMLWFAYENHRSARQSAARVSWQVLWMAGAVAIGVAVVAALP